MAELTAVCVGDLIPIARPSGLDRRAGRRPDRAIVDRDMARSPGILWCVVLVACRPEPDMDGDPLRAGWHRIDAGGFSLAVPDGFERVEVQGIDSNVGELRGPGTVLTWDLGWYSNPLADHGQTGFAAEPVTIDGRAGRLVTFAQQGAEAAGEHCAGLHFQDLGDGQTKLTVFARCNTPAERAIAERILRSLRFR
jgi:hypothetical protein